MPATPCPVGHFYTRDWEATQGRLYRTTNIPKTVGAGPCACPCNPLIRACLGWGGHGEPPLRYRGLFAHMEAWDARPHLVHQVHVEVGHQDRFLFLSFGQYVAPRVDYRRMAAPVGVIALADSIGSH